MNNTHEFIYHFTADGAQDIDKRSIGVPYTHKGNLERFDHDVDLRCRGNCWFVPYEPINSSAQRGNHPATFPADIPEMCIKLSGKKAGVVLDPFVGTGTTAIVASNLGFDAIGFDISQQYLDFATQPKTPKKTPKKKVPSTYTGSPLPITIPDGTTLKVLELFSGTGSVGKIAEKIRGCHVVSVDVEPETAGYNPTVVCDVLKLDYKNLGFIPDVIWASPPCQTYSGMASGAHRTKADMTPKTAVGKLGKKILEKTVEIISYFYDLNPNLKFYMENPHGGTMKYEKTVLEILPPKKMVEVSKFCAELEVGDKIEVMFNDAKNTDKKHIPK
eukprot:SAG22_NODE_2940_length_2088_cov_3.696833_1_plen_329_part_10